MFEKSENFPENWFFIKNHSNGYVLMVENESQETGSPIVLSTIRTKDYAAQLWRYDPKGFLINKKSGQVMDVAKGKVSWTRYGINPNVSDFKSLFLIGQLAYLFFFFF